MERKFSVFVINLVAVEFGVDQGFDPIMVAQPAD